MEPIDGRLSVLMPCHNEAHLLRRNIRDTVRVLEGALPGKYELLVIDDGSLDTSWEEAKSATRRFSHVRVLRYVSNRGKGYALRYGFRHSRGDYICFLDGDLDIHPRHIPRFVRLMQQEEADVVAGSKRHPQSRVAYPAKRRLLSSTYNAFVRALFGLPLRDTQVGLKLFRRRALEEAFPRVVVKKYAFDLELLLNIHALGYRIVEAPVEFTFVNQDGSGVNPRAILDILRDSCAIFYRSRILHYYDRPHPEVVGVEEPPEPMVSVEAAADVGTGSR